MNEIMSRLEAWLAKNAPPLLQLLNPPASADDIKAFEARNSIKLPPAIRELYAIHDGESEDSGGIFGCLQWMPLSQVAEEIESQEFKGMFPFLLSGGGDMVYVKAPEEGAKQDL